MKIEKIQKCMSKRTVVVKTSETVTVGVITKVDNGDNTVIVSGYTPEDGDLDYNWADFGSVRKATDDERAAFFAWLREDGRDVADGFERLSGAPRGWEDAPAPATERAVFNVDTPINQRGQVVGKWVRCLDNDSDNGRVGTCTHADNTRLPYRVTFDDGDERYVYSVEVIEDAPAAAPPRLTVGDRVEITTTDFDGNGGVPREVKVGEVGTVISTDGSTRCPFRVRLDKGDAWVFPARALKKSDVPAPPRLTVGDSAIAVSGDGRAVMGKITRDDQDSSPYIIDGKHGCFRKDKTHPLTIDGFRAAAAQQRAEGVTFEEGDYAALIADDGEVRAGTISGRAGGLVCLHFAFATYAALKGSEDWTDRVVVLTKRPKI